MTTTLTTSSANQPSDLAELIQRSARNSVGWASPGSVIAIAMEPGHAATGASGESIPITPIFIAPATRDSWHEVLRACEQTSLRFLADEPDLYND